MNPGVLFLIASDPRTSPRPAEAVRIATGLGAGGMIRVAVYFHGPAIRALGEWAEALVEEADFRRAWPILRAGGAPVYVQQGAPELAEVCEPALPFTEIDTPTLAGLGRDSAYVLHF